MNSRCVVFWDYENISIPKKIQPSHAFQWIETTIHAKLGRKIPVVGKVYVGNKNCNKFGSNIKQMLDTNGYSLVEVPDTKAEAVDKRMLVDIVLEAYRWSLSGEKNWLVVITGDKDFGYCLSNLKNTAAVRGIGLILLQPKQVDENLLNSVHWMVCKNSKKKKGSNNNNNNSVYASVGSNNNNNISNGSESNNNNNTIFAVQDNAMLQYNLYQQHLKQSIILHPNQCPVCTFVNKPVKSVVILVVITIIIIIIIRRRVLHLLVRKKVQLVAPKINGNAVIYHVNIAIQTMLVNVLCVV